MQINTRKKVTTIRVSYETLARLKEARHADGLDNYSMEDYILFLLVERSRHGVQVHL
jgi:hypothetical protein